jgi:MFS family permease
VTVAPESDQTAEGPFRAVFGDPTLRRLQLAVLGSMLGRFGFVVALAVWAYRHGGAGLVGLAGFLRIGPGALVAPFASALADRHRREHVMAVSDIGRAVLFAGIAVLVAVNGPVAAVLGLVTLTSLFGAVFEPARAALMPSLVATPERLTAANAVSSAVNSTSYFLGPAVGGLLLAATSPQLVFSATAVALVWSAANVMRLHPRPVDGDEDSPATVVAGDAGAALDLPDDGPEPEIGKAAGLLDDVREGMRVVAGDRGVLLLVGMFGLQTLISGALGVFVVVLALHEFDAGQAWVGYLQAAAGAGSFAGAYLVGRLLTRHRLSTGTLAGLVLWGLPLLLVAFVDVRGVALVAMVLIGVGDSMIDVCGYTLLQRVVPEALLGRVFGLLEAVVIAGLGLGALLAPVLISAFGMTVALIIMAALPAVGLGGLRRLHVLDERATVPGRPRALLRALPMFRLLPLPALDRLALRAEQVDVAAGDAVIVQGHVGDRFFVIDQGEVDVWVDGRHARTLGPGDGFGEIALLRDVPRTATVSALRPARLLAVARDDFLGAVSGHAGAWKAADGLAAARLARQAPHPVAPASS